MKRLAAALLSVILLLSLCACSSGGTDAAVIYDDVVGVRKGGEQLSGDQLLTVAENETYSLSIVPDTGYFEVVQKDNGYVYSSYPAATLNNDMSNFMALAEIKSTLSISYGDLANRITAQATSYTDSIMMEGHTVYKTENGFVEFYEFPSISITVPVRVTLSKRGILAEVVLEGVEEKGDFILTDISLLKYFGAGAYTDEGYMVVPDGSGAVVKFSNGKHTYPAVSIPVYGSDSVLGDPDVSENKAYMPVFGIKNSGGSFLAVIEKGEANVSVNASVAGNNDAYNHAYASFNVRGSALVGVSTTSIDYSSKNFIVFDEKNQSINCLAVRYILLSGGSGEYSDMAAAYRQYLIEKGTCKESENTELPLYLNMVCSVNVDRNVFGFSVKEAIATAPFESIAGYAKRLADAGVDGLNIRLEAWSKSDIKNKVFKKADALSVLGGNKGLEGLSEALADISGRIYAATDLVHIKPSNKYGARNINRRITDIYPIALNTLAYDKIDSKDKLNLLSPAFFGRSAGELIASAGEAGYGLSFACDKDFVYSDFGDNYSKRQQSVKYLSQVYNNAKKGKVALGEQKPSAFAIPYLESAFWLGGSYAANDMEDYQIPFYQLSVSGLVSYSSEPLNLSLDRNTSFMRSLEYGAGLMYTLITQNAEYVYVSDNTSLYNCIADGLFDSITDNYKAAADFYDAVGTRILSHTTLAEQVYLSEYNNACAVFNYSDTDYMYKGKAVAAGSYLIVESGANQ